jgi:uncharacterized membrane-anchored protein YhcB (DUF1043 family)
VEPSFAWSSLLFDPVALAISLLALLGAFWIGFAIGRGRSRDAVERAREAEDRLQLAEDEMNRYRQEVSEHFGQTSQLLRDLTLQYRNVYEHLAEGARTLCPEAGTLLPGSLADALPARASDAPRGNGASAGAEDDGQLDLLENADHWHEHAGAEIEELEPLLDERIEPGAEAQPESKPVA